MALRNSLPPVEHLRKKFAYDPQTGVITNVGRPNEPSLCAVGSKRKIYGSSEHMREGMPAEFFGNNGYMFVKFNGRAYAAHRIAWALHYGEHAPLEIDHANRDRHDNRIKNLRLATRSQNAANRRPQDAKTSQYLGVHAAGKKWRASIKTGGSVIYLGTFNDERSAAIAYDCAAINIHREFANPNIVQNPYLTTPPVVG